MRKQLLGQLRQLARLYGVQTAYTDMFQRRKQATPEALLHGLRSLGAALRSVDDVPSELRERQRAHWNRVVEPTVAVWDGGPTEMELRLPADKARGSLHCELKLESGEVLQTYSFKLARLRTPERVKLEGVRYVAKKLRLPDKLPWGYHRLLIEAAGRLFETRILCAPRRAFQPKKDKKSWGVFLPLYSLQSERNWGAGDLTDLATLMDWTASLGGRVVGTLPLSASFLDVPFDPSPYSPVSRLFWNELYIDLQRVPELEMSATARTLLGSDGLRQETEALRSAPFVDYQRHMALKRRILEKLAHSFFRAPGTYLRRVVFRAFVQGKPELESYARFRATLERRRTPWHAWPRPLSDGILKEGDYDSHVKDYHLYVQWLAEEQLQALSPKAASGLYLDLPLGVHRDGYDTWQEQRAFALNASGGAPPDRIFPVGQDWGFPPLHPEAIRMQGYRYVIAYLRHQMRHARMLRIDHVMGLLDSEGHRAKRGGLRSLPPGGALRHPVLGVSPEPHRDRRREPGHGSELRQPGHEPAQHQENVRASVLDFLPRPKTTAPRSCRLGGVPQYSRHPSLPCVSRRFRRR
jgi:4-alpha-glucanotransferase